MTEHNLLRRIWHETPPITRYIALISFTTTMLVYLKLATVHHLSFSSYHILHNFHLWRLLTPFFYFGKLNIETILHIVFLVRYSRMLEENITSSEYLMLVICIMAVLKCVDIFNSINLRMGHCFASIITYIWTRKNPNTQVQLLGCVTFPAFYLSFIVPMLSVLSDRRVPKEDLYGIVVGQFLFYFKYVWPRFGYDFLRTPDWMKKIYGEYYENATRNDGNVNVNANGNVNANRNVAENTRTVETEQVDLLENDDRVERVLKTEMGDEKVGDEPEISISDFDTITDMESEEDTDIFNSEYFSKKGEKSVIDEENKLGVMRSDFHIHSDSKRDDDECGSSSTIEAMEDLFVDKESDDSLCK